MLIAATSEGAGAGAAVAFFLVIVGGWAAFWGGIGVLIGKGKGRPWTGFLLGIFLTWIGWIIVAVLDRTPEAEVRRGMQVREHEAVMLGRRQAGWHPDPEGRHQFRWFNGTQWTSIVADNGETANDHRFRA